MSCDEVPIVHITPVDDILHHDEEGTMCPCKPTLKNERLIGVVFIVHQAFDMRDNEWDGINPHWN